VADIAEVIAHGVPSTDLAPIRSTGVTVRRI
jgi:hypothetical protein